LKANIMKVERVTELRRECYVIPDGVEPQRSRKLAIVARGCMITITNIER